MNASCDDMTRTGYFNRFVLLAAALMSICALPSAFAGQAPLTELWNTTVSPGGVNFGGAAAVGPDGHAVMVGASCDLDEVNCDIRTIKYDSSTGNVLWNVTFNSGGVKIDFADRIAVGPDGHSVVAGSSCDGDGSACAARLIKYDGAIGSVLWNVSFSSGQGNDVARGVAVGLDGHPILTVASCNVDRLDCTFRTIKFNGATGSIIWNVTFSSPSGNDFGYDVAVHADGHAVVTGSSCASDNAFCDFRTIKYDGASGALLWTVTFDSGFDSGSESDTGLIVSIGADGHPVISGQTCSVATACDGRVMKLDGATGSIVWNVLFVLPGHSGFGPASVGADGNLVTFHNSCDDEGDHCEGAMTKLNGSTGAVLWSQTFPGIFHVVRGGAIGVDGSLVIAGSGQPCNEACFLTFKYLEQHDTPVGSSIAVELNGGSSGADGVGVTYTSVTAAGTTTLVTNTSGPVPPAGFGFLGIPPTYYELATTATFSGSIVVCVNYATRPFAGPEADLRLFHFESGNWVDVTFSLDTVAHVICGSTTSLSPFAIAEAGNVLTALGPAVVWVGLKNSDDVGIRFDLRVEVYRNGDQWVASGQVDSVAGGSSGFNNAQLRTITLTPIEPAVFPSGSTLSIKVLGRNACTGSGKNSGSARLWYGDAAANSRFEAVSDASDTYYLRSGLLLGMIPGPSPKKTADIAAGSKCSAFKSFGVWTTTIP